MTTYFDLVVMRSYKTSGPSGRRYFFYKGNPLTVEHIGDAEKFRNQPDIFFECDQNGEKVFNSLSNTNKGVKSYNRFKQRNFDPESVLGMAGIQAENNRKQQGLSADDIMKAASNDSKNANFEVKPKKEAVKPSKPAVEEEDDEHLDDGTVMGNSNEGIEAQDNKKKSKAVKKDPLKCDLCGFKAKDRASIVEHLEKHSDED